MRRRLAVVIVGAALGLVTSGGLVAGAASAMVCLDGQGVTVVVDDRRSTEPDASCVPEGADRPAAEVLSDAATRVERPSPWTFWSSDGRGTWTPREGTADVSVPQGGFLAWSRGDEPPRTAPRPQTELERTQATRPAQERRIGEEHALADVLRVVGVVVVVVVVLLGSAWVVQRRQDRPRSR